MAAREEIVVPAALTGSRKDTLLMRLNNRVRLLERNVSVSMRLVTIVRFAPTVLFGPLISYFPMRHNCLPV